MRARKVDANLFEIVCVARRMGFLVNIRNDDFADLDVQFRGIHEAWECKSSKGRPTKRQMALAEKGWKIRTVRSVDDVISARKQLV